MMDISDKIICINQPAVFISSYKGIEMLFSLFIYLGSKKMCHAEFWQFICDC